VLAGGGSHFSELVMNFVAGVGEVLEELDLVIEVDEEGLVAVFGGFGRVGQHEVDEFAGGGALVVDGAIDAAAGVDEESAEKGQWTLDREALDRLGFVVFREGEVGRGEVGDEVAMLVANGDGKQDLVGLDLERGNGLAGAGRLGAGRRGKRCSEGEGKSENEKRRGFHRESGLKTLCQQFRRLAGRGVDWGGAACCCRGGCGRL
jgi:hypothetical protein